MIEIENLTKHFPVGKDQPDIVAVENLSLEVARGEIFGFLGPNGAGKTTTVRVLTTLIAPTSGTARVNGLALGEDDQQLRRSVGVLTESPGLYERLTAWQNMMLYARLYGVNDPEGQARKYLDMLGLWERRNELAGGYSKGMKQKLAIVRALMHEPDTLFLDEPTSALDPSAAKTVRDFIAELRAEGHTIFICTHNLAEAERLCDRIAIFKTNLLVVDTPRNLRRQARQSQVILFQMADTPPVLADIAGQFPFVSRVSVVEGGLQVTLDDPLAHNPQLVAALVQAGAEIQLITPTQPALENAYLRWVGALDETPSEEAAP